MSRLGVTAHGGPCGTLQFDRLGSRPWPPPGLPRDKETENLNTDGLLAEAELCPGSNELSLELWEALQDCSSKITAAESCAKFFEPSIMTSPNRNAVVAELADAPA